MSTTHYTLIDKAGDLRATIPAEKAETLLGHGAFRDRMSRARGDNQVETVDSLRVSRAITLELGEITLHLLPGDVLMPR